MMHYDPDKHHRRTIRLKGYDYTQPGAYSVTIVTQGRGCLFGDVVDDEMCTNKSGVIATYYWRAIPSHFTAVELDAFILMPNHIHGIIWIKPVDDIDLVPSVAVGAKHLSPNASPSPRGTSPASLAAIVQNYKSVTTRKINQLHSSTGSPVWQRNYYEHIIRDDDDLTWIREYIRTNPMRWAEDEENPFGRL